MRHNTSDDQWGGMFPDSAFLVCGLLIMSLIQLTGAPLTEGVYRYLTAGTQQGLAACFFVGSLICLIGLVAIRRDALIGGWIQAGGLLGIQFGLCGYIYLLATRVEGWWITPTAWLLFGLVAMIASRCVRVVLFTVSVFRQAQREVHQDRIRP